MKFDWIEKPGQSGVIPDWCIIKECISDICWVVACPSRCDAYGCPSECGMIFSAGIACL